MGFLESAMVVRGLVSACLMELVVRKCHFCMYLASCVLVEILIENGFFTVLCWVIRRVIVIVDLVVVRTDIGRERRGRMRRGRKSYFWFMKSN